jgi:hypothetical protein
MGAGECLRTGFKVARNAEIRQLDAAARRNDDILGLDVAVYDAALVRVIERVEHLRP